MFYKSSLILLTALFTSNIAAADNNEIAPKFTSGLRYRIVNPASGTWARNLPGPGHQGPWLSSIVMTTQFSSAYQTWEVTPYEEGYRIRNYGSRNSAFATAHQGDPVRGYSDGVTKWYIEPAGGNEYRIHYPNKNLIWTVESDDTVGKTISIEPAQGEDTQLFMFVED